MAERVGVDVVAEDHATAEMDKIAQKGSSMSQTIGTGVRIASGVAALGFGIMAKGALDMEKAQGGFQAATGRSREEAIAFSKDMNGLVGTSASVGRSFAEITAAGTQVAQQFGLVGKAGQDMTNQFLAFSKVTHQDAASAVDDFDKALDAFGAPAERATGLMDQLVASNQKYGTEAGPAALSALAGMAPALQALGGNLDTGVGLLNLFEQAGLDASAAQRGLIKAVADLKPGQTIDDLIAQISAVEDPTKRAQTAMEIFGTRSGAGLANAIKPGMDGLSDFIITVDDASGTAGKAAEDMVTTGDRFRIGLEKVGGALRDLGQSFGPLLSGIGGITTAIGALPNTITGPLVNALGGVWTKIASNALVQGAVGKAGVAASAAYNAAATAVDGLIDFIKVGWGKVATNGGVLSSAGEAGSAAGLAYKAKALLGVGAVVAGTAAIWTVAMDQTGQWQNRVRADEATDWGKTIGQKLGAGMDQGVQDRLATIAADTIRPLLQKGIGVGSYEDGVRAAQEWLRGEGAILLHARSERTDNYQQTVPADFIGPLLPNQVRVGAMDAGTESGRVYGEGWREGYGQVQSQIAGDIVTSQRAAAERGSEAFGERWVAMGEAAYNQWAAPFRALGAAIPGDIANGLLDNSHALVDAGDRLIQLLKKGMTPHEQALKFIGKKYTDAVAAGIHSTIPGAKEAAQELALSAINAIEDGGEGKSKKGMKAMGEYYSSLMASGMTAQQAQVALATAGVGDAVIAALTGIAPQAGPVAQSYVNHFTAALLSAKPEVNRAIFTVFGPSMAGQSPPKEGPLSKIDKWGENVGAVYPKSVALGIVAGHKTVAAALAGMPKPGAMTGHYSIIGAGPRADYDATNVGRGNVRHTVVNNHFGANSVRSDDDIRRISVETARAARHSGAADNLLDTSDLL